MKMKPSEVKQSRRRVAKAYARHKPEDLIIRDLLALDRTTLANERTFLAYFRTSFVLCGTGITLIKLFPDMPEFYVLGYLLLPISVFTLVCGTRRFFRTRRALLALNEEPEKGDCLIK